MRDNQTKSVTKIGWVEYVSVVVFRLIVRFKSRGSISFPEHSLREKCKKKTFRENSFSEQSKKNCFEEIRFLSSLENWFSLQLKVLTRLENSEH